VGFVNVVSREEPMITATGVAAALVLIALGALGAISIAEGKKKQ
jgi:hypothetical protein